MKKLFLIAISATMLCSSCATLLGGKPTKCQTTRPAPAEPSRQIRIGALIADCLLFTPGIIVDFVTGSIYKPCEPKKK